MRAGELTAPKRRRVDLEVGRIDVVEAVGEVGRALVTGPTKTGKRRSRMIPRFQVEILADDQARYPSPEFVFTAAESPPGTSALLSTRRAVAVRRGSAAQAGWGRGDAFPDGGRGPTAGGCHHPSLPDPDLHGRLLRDASRRVTALKRWRVDLPSIRVTSDRYGHLFP